MSRDGEALLADLARLRRVRDRMDREYAQPLDVEALARGVHMSAGHLSRQFKQAYGESPYSYLMTRRIERAKALLRRGDMSVTDVCFAVGCASLGTFSTRFTELVGVSPSAYRARSEHAEDGMPPCEARRISRPVRNRTGGAGGGRGPSSGTSGIGAGERDGAGGPGGAGGGRPGEDRGGATEGSPTGGSREPTSGSGDGGSGASGTSGSVRNREAAVPAGSAPSPS